MEMHTKVKQNQIKFRKEKKTTNYAVTWIDKKYGKKDDREGLGGLVNLKNRLAPVSAWLVCEIMKEAQKNAYIIF